MIFIYDYKKLVNRKVKYYAKFFSISLSARYHARIAPGDPLSRVAGISEKSLLLRFPLPLSSVRFCIPYPDFSARADRSPWTG
jgi:hypothetical protein